MATSLFHLLISYVLTGLLRRCACLRTVTYSARPLRPRRTWHDTNLATRARSMVRACHGDDNPAYVKRQVVTASSGGTDF
jgi:hypothetical protein